MRRALMLVLGLGLVSCATNDGSLQLDAVLVPTSDCQYEVGSETFWSSGLYDPRGFGGVAPRNYVMAMRVKNTVERPRSLSDASGGLNTHDAEVISVDLCWFRADPGSDGEPEFEGYVDGVPDNLTCDKLPETQRKTVTVAAPVPAEGASSVSVDLFDWAALQVLYGTSFEPSAITDLGLVRLSRGDAPAWLYSSGTPDPTDLAARDPAWGSFPASQTARVIVQARANAVLLSGGSIQSNWLIFPVDICVGCLANACGLLELTECEPGDVCADDNSCPPLGQCADGSYCEGGATCPDATACPATRCEVDGTVCTSGVWGAVGAVADPLSAEACLPFQDEGPPPCIELLGCIVDPGTTP